MRGGSGETARAEVGIVGGGIVGLATAYEWTRRFPARRVLVFEKEHAPALHQSGANSGVLHSGIYYAPGSQKARLCCDGRRRMRSFCEEHALPFEICGKVIVAVAADELPLLQRIEQRGRANGVRSRRVGPERLRELEPHAAGLAALHVPDAGIVDFRAVCETLARQVTHAGGDVWTGAEVRALTARERGVIVETSAGAAEVGLVVNCAGLHSDHVAELAGMAPRVRIVPFRGEYDELMPGARRLCRHLIYPVPDPRFPFLGVHRTRNVRGGVECGPNAVLALAREGYRRRDVSVGDVRRTVGFPGFRRLLARHWRIGAAEWARSLYKPARARALRRLVPALRSGELRRARTGVRAQAVGGDGRLVDDFLIEETERAIHVLNAPSPAATSALSIARELVGKIAARD